MKPSQVLEAHKKDYENESSKLFLKRIQKRQSKIRIGKSKQVKNLRRI